MIFSSKINFLLGRSNQPDAFCQIVRNTILSINIKCFTSIFSFYENGLHILLKIIDYGDKKLMKREFQAQMSQSKVKGKFMADILYI